MKHNLKNRPRCHPYELKQTMIENVENWFEGFEKELRDIQQIEPTDHVSGHVQAIVFREESYIRIKEILGEDAP